MHQRGWWTADRDEPLACVIGTMDLLRPLGLAGIRCAVVARLGSRVRYSRFTRAVVDWADPCREPDVLLDRLLSFGAAQRARPVLYYEGDWDLLLVSRHRERLAEAFRFVLPDAGLVEDLVDKARFRGLAERLELPVPRSRVLPAAAPEEDVDLDPPLVVKPLTRDARTWERVGGDAKAVETWTREELSTVRGRLAAAGVDALAQELIPGPETRIESYHVYVDEAGEVAGEFTGRKLRTWPLRNGHSTALELTEEEDVLTLGRECTARLGLRGVAKLDFKRAPDESLRLLEVNPRFNLWHHLGAVGGANLPALVFADLVGVDRPAVAARPGTRWCQPRHDLRAARAEGVSLGRWLRFALSCEARSALAWDDPFPIVRGAGARLRRHRSIRRSAGTPAAADG